MSTVMGRVGADPRLGERYKGRGSSGRNRRSRSIVERGHQPTAPIDGRVHFVILALSARAADTAAVDTLAEDLARQVLPEVRGDAVATLVRAEGVTPDWFHVAAFEGLLLSKLSTRSFMSVTVVADRDKLVNAADSAARRSELAVRSGALWLL